MTDTEDKNYCNSVEKCRRQRKKIRSLLDHIDIQKELIFKPHIFSAG